MHRVTDNDPYLRPSRKMKKRANGQRVRDVECGVFTPLFFSTTGGMGREATTFYKRLADKLAQKQQKPYPVVICWLRRKLSFAAVRSSIMCIRGTRSSFNRPPRDVDITLATSEGGILRTVPRLFRSFTHSPLFFTLPCIVSLYCLYYCQKK